MKRDARMTRTERARRTAQRMWPLMLEAWRRWDRLPPHEKERYRRMASDYAGRARDATRRKRGR